MKPENRKEISRRLKLLARRSSGLVRPEFLTIRDADAISLADELGCHPGDVFEHALENDIWPERYVRNHNSFSAVEQAMLARSSVAVIGAGGLGGSVILLLARLGVGHLTVVDGDVFDESNLNRQALSRTDAVGCFKVEEAEKIVGSINPAIRVNAVCTYFDGNNAGRILDGADVAVDALDTISDRRKLEAACCDLGVPIVHGAVAGFEGRVMAIYPGDPGLKALYGETPPEALADDKGDETILGAPAVITSIVGTLQAMEVLKLLLGKGRIFQKRLAHLDLQSGRFSEFCF